MAKAALPILEFVVRNYRNFNSRATRDALFAYWDLIRGGGRMYWAMAGAMALVYEAFQEHWRRPVVDVLSWPRG